MVKKLQRLVTFKLRKKYFTAIKLVLDDVDFENVLVTTKISSGEKSYKYFIGYLYDDNDIKPLLIIILKTCTYVESYDGQTKWMYFLIEDNDVLEKRYFGIKSVLILKKNLIVSLFIMKNVRKPN